MRSPRWAWARWVLVVSNALAALGMASLAVFFQFGSAPGAVASLSVILVLAIALALCWLAYRQSHQRGIVPQSLLALGVLFISIPAGFWLLVPYGVFALLSTWWLGDFDTDPEPEPVRPPAHTALLLHESGASADEIRATLVAHDVAPHEAESIVYSLISSTPDNGRSP